MEPEAWGADGGASVASGSVAPSPSASALHYSAYPSHALANGLRSHDSQRHMCRRRNEEATDANLQQDRSDRRAYTHLDSDTPQHQADTNTAQALIHTESRAPSHTQGDTHPDMELESSAVQPQTHRQTPSPLLKPIPSAHTPPTPLLSTALPPDHPKPNHTTTTTCNTGHGPLSSPAELERKIL